MVSAEKYVFDLIAVATDPRQHIPKPDLDSFTHVRAYHCCRPRDIKSYEEHGVRLIPRVELEREFRSIFAHIKAEYLDEAIARYGQPCRPAQIYAGLDKRFLLEFCSHYALYGSETIKGFAANLCTPDKTNHLELLKTIGTPKVLVLEIPMDELPREFIGGLDETLQLLATESYAEVYQTGTMVDCAVSLYQPVPPEWIVSHYTPERIIDPDDRTRIYKFE